MLVDGQSFLAKRPPRASAGLRARRLRGSRRQSVHRAA